MGAGGFAYMNSEFINLYSDENPIMEADELCYFVFSNYIDYHMPLIGKGTIIKDVFNDSINKIYYIRLEDIFETPTIVNKYVTKKQFQVIPHSKNGVLGNKKIETLGPNFNFDRHLFKIDCFFVRETLKAATELRNEYQKIIETDIRKQLKDIENHGSNR